jgi:hypothetical protein
VSTGPDDLAATAAPARRQRLRALAAPVATIGLGVAGAVAVWVGDPTSSGGMPLPPCPSKLLFGVCCPGCGGTRMLYSLMHGDLASAAHYNAVSLVVVLLLCWSLAAWVVGSWQGRRIRTWLHWRWTAPVTLAVFSTWFVIRNLPFPPFSGLYV